MSKPSSVAAWLGLAGQQSIDWHANMVISSPISLLQNVISIMLWLLELCISISSFIL